MLRNLWSEFKAFAFKGNMIELAVAVVIGGAFGNVIHAMVTDIINPAISYAVTGVKEVRDTAAQAAGAVKNKVVSTPAATTQSTTAPLVTNTPPTPTSTPVATETPATGATAAPGDPAKAVDLDWKVGRFLIGDFIGAIINFLIIAFAVFILIVKLTDSVMKKVGSTPNPGEPTTKECTECLSIIPLKAKRCPNCTSILIPAPANA